MYDMKMYDMVCGIDAWNCDMIFRYDEFLFLFFRIFTWDLAPNCFLWLENYAKFYRKAGREYPLLVRKAGNWCKKFEIG